MVRYFSTQRPVSMGSYPGGYEVHSIHNFDRKTFCEEIGRETWGYIDFDAQLSEDESKRYELTMAGLKMFWCVTSSFDDRGRTAAHITRTTEALEKPKNSYKSTSRKDIYNDWFDSYEAAEKFAEQTKRA